MIKLNFIILGDIMCGKTQLINKFVSNGFNEKYNPTIAIDFDSRTLFKDIKVQIWDTSGQDVHKPSMRIWCKSAHVAIVVYTSLGATMTWMQELEKNAPIDLLIVLIGTKRDLSHESNKMAQQLAKQLNISYFETSAKTGLGIKDLFETCVKQRLKTWQEPMQDSDISMEEVLIPKSNKKISYLCCC
jgi:small GTP-binding protein